MSQELKSNKLNSLYAEYRHRFRVEFEKLLEAKTFAEAIFQNHDVLFRDPGADFVDTLKHCFESSFESMALGLARVWEETKPKGGHRKLEHFDTISLPMLVTYFSAQDYFGVRGLCPGEPDRLIYDALLSDPLRCRLRIARTEALAHAVTIGASADRKKSDIERKRTFEIANEDLLEYCRKTLALLRSVNDQLFVSDWRGGKTLCELTEQWRARHVAFLRYFAPDAR